jgi:hypothetical protein
LIRIPSTLKVDTKLTMNFYYNLFLDPCGFPHQTTSQCVYLGFQTFCCWVVVVIAAYIVGYLLWRIIKHHDTTRKHRSQVLG